MRNPYMTRFFESNAPTLDGILRTEVPKAYAVVESYLGSLYAKNPSVEVLPDIRGRGNAEVAEATARAAGAEEAAAKSAATAAAAKKGEIGRAHV